VGANGGIGVSFNGNSYAINAADVAVVSGHTEVLHLMARSFEKKGKDGLLAMIDLWEGALKEDKALEMPDGSTISSDIMPVLARITVRNQEDLCNESEVFRRRLRGEKIGTLG
jgi:energy-converting hydrogenase A subunit R